MIDGDDGDDDDDQKTMQQQQQQAAARQTPIPGANRKVGRGNRRRPNRHQKYFLKPTPNYSNYQMGWEDEARGCACLILIIRMDGCMDSMRDCNHNYSLETVRTCRMT